MVMLKGLLQYNEVAESSVEFGSASLLRLASVLSVLRSFYV